MMIQGRFGKGNRANPEETDRNALMVKLYTQPNKVPQYDLARRFGVHISRVNQILRRAGVLRPRKLIDTDSKKIIVVDSSLSPEAQKKLLLRQHQKRIRLEKHLPSGTRFANAKVVDKAKFKRKPKPKPQSAPRKIEALVKGHEEIASTLDQKLRLFFKRESHPVWAGFRFIFITAKGQQRVLNLAFSLDEKRFAGSNTWKTLTENEPDLAQWVTEKVKKFVSL